MNTQCFFSSFVFLSNVINNFLHGDCIYGGIFLMLFFTSILHHYYCESWTNILDKFSIIAVIIYGGSLYYKKTNLRIGDTDLMINYVPIVCFYLTVFLYLYGDITDQYCFDKTGEIANNYHALLHIISSIGHHAIVSL